MSKFGKVSKMIARYNGQTLTPAQGSSQMTAQQSIKRVKQGTIQKAPSVNSGVIRGSLRKVGRSILG